MAEERDQIDPERETDEIQDEIERTRTEMRETLGEIQQRLSPDRLLHQAKESVQEAAKQKMRSVGLTTDQVRQYLRKYPAHLLVAGAGVTWLVARRRRSNDREYEGSMDTYGDRNHSGTEGEHTSRARQVTEQVRGAAATTGAKAQRAWEQAGSSVERWSRENPLAVGAVALAVGAAVGLSIRRTQVENQAFGDVRDSVVDQAGEVARDLRNTITEKAQGVAEQALNEFGGDRPSSST